jgi:hypothetical protein
MLHVLTALILGTIFNSELLQGGILKGPNMARGGVNSLLKILQTH